VSTEKIWMGKTYVSVRTSSGNHHHGDSETAIYVVSGHPEFVFAEGVGDSVEEVRIKTSPGDYIFVPPFVPHREENPGEDEEAVIVIARSTQEAIVVNLPRLYALDPATGEPPRGDRPAGTSGVAQEMIVARIRHGTAHQLGGQFTVPQQQRVQDHPVFPSGLGSPCGHVRGVPPLDLPGDDLTLEPG
jgi:uncharacterized RmlC-like cupin family protein